MIRSYQHPETNNKRFGSIIVESWGNTTMKPLLMLGLFAMLCGGAFAYEYHEFDYQFALFFTPMDQLEGDGESGHTNYDYGAFEYFYMHLVVRYCPASIEGYEMRTSGVPYSAIASWLPLDGSGWQNAGNSFNHIATFAVPQAPPYSRAAVYLGRWQMILLQPSMQAFIALLPSEPSSIDGDGPVVFVNGQTVRANFSHIDHVPSAPGSFPQYMATLHGPGIRLWYPGLDADQRSLTNLKSLFR